ncbi:Mitochondrial fission process protein 1 [Phytophthora ramorum]|uniref:Mitochondrial fission process protein 1 n=1 Tax=Phytophthora ramorum TaxID=164328 RepID=UPI0030AC167B|nr:Mitochondrial fission process protein 1 [Phytophthora ramorum]
MAAIMPTSHFSRSSESEARMVRHLRIAPYRRRIVLCIASLPEHFTSLTVESIGIVKVPPAMRERWITRLKAAWAGRFVLSNSGSATCIKYTVLRTLNTDSHTCDLSSLVVAGATIDTLAWQTMASVVIPGLTINRVVALSCVAVQRAAKNSPVVRRWAPTAIGLGVIPLIIHPIDSFVDAAMDKSLRKWSKDFLDGMDK